jgi:hypothetical protein
MSVFVIRAFVKMRQTLPGNRELAEKLAALEKNLTGRLGARGCHRKSSARGHADPESSADTNTAASTDWIYTLTSVFCNGPSELFGWSIRCYN